MEYQGHKSWNHWNVALWLFNDYGTYEMMQEMVDVCCNRNEAARQILGLLPAKTPDGAPYTYTSIRAALVGWES